MPSKQEIIDERKANLPLPEQPPHASDWNSLDERTVNVGSGGVSADISSSDSLRGPAAADSDVRVDGEEYKSNTVGRGAGREGQDNLGGLPNDAISRDAKNKSATVDTTGKDYGYPQKSDPSSGLQ